MPHRKRRDEYAHIRFNRNGKGNTSILQGQGRKGSSGGIGQEAADVFNKLLDESKKRCSKNQFIEKMHPVTLGRTQLAGLLAKVGVFEDSLKAEGST
jgi:hypothetical protein